jgi:anaerobic selenocysteine-containing dehydrogenase
MSDITRRTFLKQSGATAAAAGALVAVPKGLDRTHSKTAAVHRTTAASSKARTTAQHTLVVHIPDSRKGELRVLVGDRQVVIHDRDLVARLQRAAG